MVTNRKKVVHVTHLAFKIIGLPIPDLSDLNSKAIKNRAQIIANDLRHTLNSLLDIDIVPNVESGMVWEEFRALCYNFS